MLSPLRDTQQGLAARVGRETPLSEETDRIVDSVGVTAHVLASCWS